MKKFEDTYSGSWLLPSTPLFLSASHICRSSCSRANVDAFSCSICSRYSASLFCIRISASRTLDSLSFKAENNKNESEYIIRVNTQQSNTSLT